MALIIELNIYQSVPPSHIVISGNRIVLSTRGTKIYRLSFASYIIVTFCSLSASAQL